ncbi:HOF1 [Candida pseudojiufengensis]|uniref:HOF1 n=1 Tax=Candida pseudojiufengensis TaxID=497109 RepID=UPI0022251E17|nr:HOF1 [Candida pseudojiufengensis]KAI5959392.1 HOF1 [Candida pseudojiufengensis]
MRTTESQQSYIEFVNNFWGVSPEQSFHIISTRINDSLLTLKEMIIFYQEKISIEKEYNKRLEKLSHKCSIGSRETGTLKKSLDKLLVENQSMINYNWKFVKSLNQLNLEKLEQFNNLYIKKVTKLKNHIDKLIHKRSQVLRDLNQYKSKYQEECSMIKSLKLSLQTTWGKELEKNQIKYNKIAQSLNTTNKNYQHSISIFKEINDIYKRDWVISINDFYKLEIERIQILKINCFTYCNNIATLCVDLDQSIDLARSEFALVVPQQDIQEFGINYGTGNKIFDDPVYVDYMTGCDEPQVGYTISNLKNPDHNEILTRTYSTYSAASKTTTNDSATHNNNYPTHHHHQPQRDLYNMPSSPIETYKEINSTPLYTQNKTQLPKSPFTPFSPLKDLPTNGRNQMTTSPKANLAYNYKAQTPITNYNDGNTNSPYKSMLPTTTPTKIPPLKNQNDISPIRKAPLDLLSHKTQSTVSTSEDNDVFSLAPNKDDKLTNSQGSNSSHSNYSSSERNWASPRRREKQIQQMQDQITRKSTGDFKYKRQQPQILEEKPIQQQKVPIMKDFSIDFIAKALEDLNSGGDGDVNQFRRSVRSSNGGSPIKQSNGHHQIQLNNQYNYNDISPKKMRPKSDYIDDHNEIAQRYDSINFTRPKSMIDIAETKPIQQQQQQQQLTNQNPYHKIHPYQKYKSQPPTPSKPPQQQKLTPINQKPYLTKATAKYSYKPQHKSELFFRKGWEMYILHKQEDNWFICELGENCSDEFIGMIGLVPGNYIVEHD